jgi:uroporphyrin-III C-methyltransferase/precorrin-2 dehydrogenase/sirohydrochlorin ferrochelatase
MMLLPTFLKLASRKVVLVGGGRVAASKLGALLEAGACVTVVAPEVRHELQRPGVIIIRRAFQDSDLEGAWWVVAAAPPDVNRQVLAAAEARRLFVNAVDDPAHATAYAGGVVRRNDVAVAISTDGRAPALAGLLREALDAWLPADLDQWLAASDAARRRWRADRVPMDRRRPQLLEMLNRLYEERKGGGSTEQQHPPSDHTEAGPYGPGKIGSTEAGS